MTGEEIVIAFVIGCFTPTIFQRFVLPYIKQYWGIKDKPKKAKKDDDPPPKVSSKGKTYVINVVLPKDEEENK